MFFKRKKDLEQDADEWVNATFTEPERGHTILRINTGIANAVGHPTYPIRVGIAVPLTSELLQDKILYELEDFVETELCKGSKGKFVMALTGMDEPMFRELVCYTTNDIDFPSLHILLRERYQQLDVQMYAENDPEWSLYRMYQDPLKKH